MPFSRPTLPELITRTEQDFQTYLSLVGKVVRNTFVWLFARVFAGLVHGLYGYISWAARQIFPDTADEENVLRWATLFGLIRTAAAYAEGEATATGTDAVTIPAETILERADGAEFQVLTDATIAGGVAVLSVRAVAFGQDGNTELGVSLSFQTPIDGVDTDCLVTSAIGGGVDQEALEDLRVRLLSRMANPVNGGSASDYEQWAKEVAGVTRAWVKPLYLGDGTVAIFFVRDDDDDIFPSESEVAAVSAYIEAKRPVTAHQYVFAPTATFVDFTLSVLPDTQAVKDAVSAELSDLFEREGEPGEPILLSHMREAISLADGEEDYTLTSPSADFVPSDGYLPVLGTVTFT